MDDLSESNFFSLESILFFFVSLFLRLPTIRDHQQEPYEVRKVISLFKSIRVTMFLLSCITFGICLGFMWQFRSWQVNFSIQKNHSWVNGFEVGFWNIWQRLKAATLYDGSSFCKDWRWESSVSLEKLFFFFYIRYIHLKTSM